MKDGRHDAGLLGDVIVLPPRTRTMSRTWSENDLGSMMTYYRDCFAEKQCLIRRFSIRPRVRRRSGCIPIARTLDRPRALGQLDGHGPQVVLVDHEQCTGPGFGVDRQ